jgi:hypothetical protein
MEVQERLPLRQQLWTVIHHGRGLTGHAFNFLLVIVILLSLSIIPLEFLPAISTYHRTLIGIEIVTTAFFTLDYILRIYAAPERMKYVFSFYGIVDLLSILPFYLGFLGTQYIRAFNLLRVIRLVRFGEIDAAAESDELAVMKDGVGLLEGEQVEYVVSRHPIHLFFGSLGPLASITAALAILIFFPPHPATFSVAGTVFLFAMLLLWRAWLDFSYDVIYVTTYRLIFQNQHLVGRSINQVNYHGITNVKPYYPSILSYLIGYGSIKVETAADLPGQIELTTVRNHERAAHKIMQKCFEQGGSQPSQSPPKPA